ncbi:MAG: hypothetical protein A2066_16180 [Bacteroidetes bacterium GWB2_41_8]|nr:MAG: hypothetical protein A2066_16180 [Bacteroidetes bacterium GWB2_41_8]
MYYKFHTRIICLLIIVWNSHVNIFTDVFEFSKHARFIAIMLWQKSVFYLIFNLQHKNTAIKWNKL